MSSSSPIELHIPVGLIFSSGRLRQRQARRRLSELPSPVRVAKSSTQLHLWVHIMSHEWSPSTWWPFYCPRVYAESWKLVFTEISAADVSHSNLPSFYTNHRLYSVTWTNIELFDSTILSHRAAASIHCPEHYVQVVRFVNGFLLISISVHLGVSHIKYLELPTPLSNLVSFLLIALITILFTFVIQIIAKLLKLVKK